MSIVDVQSIDLIRRPDLFDGDEGDLYDRSFEVFGADPQFEFKVSDFIDNDFRDLKGKLGETNFEKILEEQGFGEPEEDYLPYWATERLKVYYYVRQGDNSEQSYIGLVSHGETQPGRYKVHYEGIWEANGAEF